MSKIVIHIGTHKTGTSHIQALFNRNQELLADHGIHVPSLSRKFHQHILAGVWNPRFTVEDGADALAAWRSLSDKYAGTDETVFVSSEELSRLQSGLRTDMAQMRELVSGFGEVVLLCTFRNQASFIQSVYQQISANRKPKDWADFYKQTVETRFCDGLSVDYDRFYSHMLTGFSRKEIHLLSYDHELGQPGGMTQAILDVIGTHLRAETLEPISARQSNISPPALATFFGNKITAPETTPDTLIRILTETLEEVYPKKKRQTLFSKAEADEIEALFSAGNEALAQRVSPYQPDFRVGPMLGGKVDLYRGQVSQAFWFTLSRRLARRSAIRF